MQNLKYKWRFDPLMFIFFKKLQKYSGILVKQWFLLRKTVSYVYQRLGRQW